MKKVEKAIIVHSPSECVKGAKLNDGRIIVLVNPDYFLSWNKEIELDGEVVTLNRLNADGKIECETSCYREYEIRFEHGFEASDLLRNGQPSDVFFKRVADEFKEHGFAVTFEALKHNYSAWKRDYKSGYRDEEHGYHLFSACGCNPLRFSATSLDDRCAEWQKTYIC